MKLLLINHPDCQFSYGILHGQPLFDLAFACARLKHSNPSEAAKMLDADQIADLNVLETAWEYPKHCLGYSAQELTIGRGNPNKKFVTFGGLLTLIFFSRLAEARKLRRLMTDVIMPAIFQFGIYVHGATIRMKRQRLREEGQRLRLEELAEGQRRLRESGRRVIREYGEATGLPSDERFAFCQDARHVESVAGESPMTVEMPEGERRAFTAPTLRMSRQIYDERTQLQLGGAA